MVKRATKEDIFNTWLPGWIPSWFLRGAFYFLTLFSISLFVREELLRIRFFFNVHDNTIFANSELMRDYYMISRSPVAGL